MNQTLGLYPATKYSSKSQKTANLKGEFWRVVAPVVAKISTDTYLSRAGILLKAPIEAAI